ncbi:MAG: DMT family transporter [Pseudobdellovibrio sp.]
MSKHKKALAEIFMASIFWGFGFIATVWAMKVFTPSLTMVYRFLISTLFGIVFLFLRNKPILNFKKEFKLAIVAGFLLGTMLLFQAYGLETTTATKNSFITSLYIFFVPLLAFILFRKKIYLFNIIIISIALLGCYLLFDMKMETVLKGDFWTLLCSVLAAIHILYIGYASKRTSDAFLFNMLQGFFALITVSVSLFFEHQPSYTSNNMLAWGGILFLAIFSSLIAFYLHVKSQKVISDSTISMLCLLESPFAALFAYFFLADKLTGIQIVGTALILSAALGQVLLEGRFVFSKQIK